MADHNEHKEEKHGDEHATQEAPKHHGAPKHNENLAKKMEKAMPKHTPAAQSSASHPAAHGGLEKSIFEQIGSSVWSGVSSVTAPLWTAAWMGGGTLVSYALTGIGPMILSGGLSLGTYFVRRKEGRNFTFQDFKNEYAKALFSGTIYYPVGVEIAATPTTMGKIAMFLGAGAPTFVAADVFADHYIKKYEKPTNFIKDIYNRDLGTVIGEGVASTITESPGVYKDWLTKSYGIVPAVGAMNWIGSHSMPLKYTVAVGTTAGYRLTTAKIRAKPSHEEQGKMPSKVIPLNPEQMQKNVQNLAASDPAAAQQLANLYQQQLSQQYAKAA